MLRLAGNNKWDAQVATEKEGPRIPSMASDKQSQCFAFGQVLEEAGDGESEQILQSTWGHNCPER